MELTMDLVSIQGIFMGLEKTPGELAKIKHKGGNECKIEAVIAEMKRYLQSKSYMDDQMRISGLHDKELTDIAMFLVLNSEFKDSTSLDIIKEYTHLIRIMPLISKCLLMNVIIDLELSCFYGNALQTLPLHLSGEMLEEAVHCLSRASPQKALQHTFIFVRDIIKKLNDVDVATTKVREAAEKLSEIAAELLLTISGLNPDNIQGWKKVQFYQHVGFTLLTLFKILLLCDPDKEALGKILDDLIRSTSNVVKAVTINIYCAWAEVNYDDDVLQLAIGAEAYYVVEKFSKYKPAKELIQILGNIAKKPKTIEETIRTASTETIINKINLGGPDQKRWLAALLVTQVFDKQESVDCLLRWSNLCTIEDVTRLLQLSMNHKTTEVKKLVIKCAAALSMEDLTITLTRYFRQFGLENHLEYDDVQQELTYRLNKINHSKERNLSLHELENSSIQEIELLMLQNPREVVQILYNECIKNTVYTYWLKHAFVVLKHVLEIDLFGLKQLEITLKGNEIADDNLTAFVHLIKMLNETGCCESEQIFKHIFLPFMDAAIKENEDVKLKYLLLISKEMNLEDLHLASQHILCVLLLNALEKYRCKFTNFTNLHMEITIAAVTILKKLQYNVTDFKGEQEYCPLNRYYTRATTTSYLNLVLPIFSMENYGDAVSKLLKILSRCVPDEWLILTNELNIRFNGAKTMEILTDTLRMISKVTKTINYEENPTVFNALQFYMQCYGMAIKNLQEKESGLQFEVEVIKSVCRLLPDVPPVLKQTNGMNLITLFSDDAVKHLANDRNFVYSLVRIGDSQLAQVIAKKMLSN